MCWWSESMWVHYKTETSSPTVSLKAMMISCAIDAKEGWYIVLTDIPGAFLHADMETDAYMLLEGTLAELIVKLEPSLYRKYIWKNKNGKPMLYVKLRKAYVENFKQLYVSETTIRYPNWMELQIIWIWQMRSKQNYTWKTMLYGKKCHRGHYQHAL